LTAFTPFAADHHQISSSCLPGLVLVPGRELFVAQLRVGGHLGGSDADQGHHRRLDVGGERGPPLHQSGEVGREVRGMFRGMPAAGTSEMPEIVGVLPGSSRLLIGWSLVRILLGVL
jgi:hypothetical protein